MSTDLILHANDPASFETHVLQSDLPVLVDFWSPTCGPCMMIAPVLDELAAEYAGRARFVKVNAHENPSVAAAFRLRGVPTLMVFAGGEFKTSQTGVHPGNMHDQIRALIDPHLAA